MEYDEFLNRIDDEGKVCLKGMYWDRAFTLITGSQKRDNSILPNPLILSGWHFTDDEEKRDRFRIHLRYASENGRWEKLLHYLLSVPEEAWYTNRG